MWKNVSNRPEYTLSCRLVFSLKNSFFLCSLVYRFFNQSGVMLLMREREERGERIKKIQRLPMNEEKEEKSVKRVRETKTEKLLLFTLHTVGFFSTSHSHHPSFHKLEKLFCCLFFSLCFFFLSICTCLVLLSEKTNCLEKNSN